MNIFKTIKEWLFPKPKETSHYTYHEVLCATLANEGYGKLQEAVMASNPLFGHLSKAAESSLEFRLGKVSKLNEEIKNLQLSIAVAKKHKKKHSHLLHEMAILKAEVLRMEVM